MIDTGGRRGLPLYTIVQIRNLCKLPGLNFLDNVCTTLQELELVTAIQSLTIAINKLLFDNGAVKNFVIKYIDRAEKNNYQKWMKECFTKSEIHTDYD